jgi:hypothetical protein
MSDHEVTIDEVLRDMLWSRRDATRLRRTIPQSLFGGLAAVAAVIDDHDRTRPTAPAAGEARVQSIVAHTIALAADVEAHPDRYSAAHGLHARSRGDVDPMLLARARSVLTELPRLATGPDDAPATLAPTEER